MDQGFAPAIWPEEPVPPQVENCSLCELSKQRTRVLWGEGNHHAHIIVVLDNPGSREDKDGNAYICGTRQTLQYAAHLAGLTTEELYVTYILKCRPMRKYDKEKARTACLAYLEEQLQNNHFEIAFCLGDTAVKTFFADNDQSVKNTRGSWHQIRGLPTYTSYHPLAVRRRPNLFGIFVEDWQQVSDKAANLKI
jgi:DNA polymerase